MSTKTLLIIGAGLQQIRAYQRAKELGLRAVGTDQNPNAPAFAYADERLLCSTRDPEETLTVVRAYAKKNAIHGVMTIANDVPLTVASVAEHLGLPNIGVASARRVSHKAVMKSCFEAAGVPTPRYVVMRNRDEFLAAVASRGFPLILKPSDGRGSKGVLFLDETIDLNWAWNTSSAACANGELMLEECAAGPQVSVESIFIDDRYVPIAFADRNYDRVPQTKPYIVEDGGVIPSAIDVITQQKISRLVETAARALGIHWGSVKADIVLTESGPVIIELAARLSGGFLATHHIPLAYGVDLVGTVIRVSLGEKITEADVQPQIRCYIGVRYMFGDAGRIKRIFVPKFTDPNIVVEQYLHEGDELPALLNAGCNAGFVLALADTHALAEKKVKEAIARVEIVTERR